MSQVFHTDPETGAKKEVKLARHDLIPCYPLHLLASVYGFGATKYDDRNWEKGYEWGYSYAALIRHLNAFWAGQDLDPESGLPHLAHAAWHCFTLMEFMKTMPHKDNRPERNVLCPPATSLDRCEDIETSTSTPSLTPRV